MLAKDAAGAETTFALPDSGAVVIGRSAGRSDLVVPGLAVSGRHCSLSRVGGAFLLRDLGSTNGTRLNGTPLSPSEIRNSRSNLSTSCRLSSSTNSRVSSSLWSM